MTVKEGAVSRRLWNAVAIALGVIAAVITVLVAREGGWPIGQQWLIVPALAFLYAAGAFMATSLLANGAGFEIRLCNFGALSALLVLGPGPAMLVVWLGVALAEVVMVTHGGIIHTPLRRRPDQALAEALHGAASAILNVWIGGMVYAALGGESAPFTFAWDNALPLLGLVAVVGALSMLSLLWWTLAVTARPLEYWRRHRPALLTHTLAGSLAAVLLAHEYPEQHVQEGVVLTLIAALLLVMLRLMIQARSTLEHRVRQLTALGDISHKLSVTLDLDEVLEAIYQEVSNLFDASEFYLALHDERSDIIDFPLIVRHGRRLSAQRRATGSSLTDYIIRHRRPLLLHSDVDAQLKQMGVAIVGPVPHSFIAAPIIIGKSVLGVIAVQHYEKDAAFSTDDVGLLETLASQAATALQNARLYQRVSRQAEHLASLNQAFTLMGASLDPDEVIEHVCEITMQVMGAQKVAVFMRIGGGDRVRMVKHIGLSEEYVADAQSLEIGSERTRVIAQNEPLVVTDVRSDPRMEEIIPLSEHEGFRALAEVPLRIERRVIGALTVYYDEPRVFEANEVALMSALGGQVAIAVENAHLFERAHIELGRRVRELETIETLSREMTSQLDLEAVMRQVIEAAAAATEAEFVEIATLDEREQVLNSVAKKDDIELTYNDWPANKGISGRALRAGEPMLVTDVTQDPDYVPGHPNCRSELAIPIIHGTRRLGVLNLESPRLDAFTGEHQRFVATLAKHAAIAIENARLFENARRQVLELEALRSAATALLVSPNVKEALAVIAEHALLLTGAQDIHLYLYDDETDVLTFGASLWDTGERDAEFAVPRLDGLTGRVARSGRTIVVEDMARHPLFAPVALKTKDPRWRSGAIIGIPVNRGDRVIGVFNIAFREPRRFSEQELHILDLLATQAAVAIDHARLMEQIRDARDRLQAILNSTYDGILMFDNRLRLLLANPRAEYILHLIAADHEGKTYLQIVEYLLQEYGPDAVGYTLEEAADLMAGIQETPLRITRRRYELDHPALRAVEEITVPVTGESGEMIGRLFVLRDATQEVEMEEYREELTGMIVHDLRAPLSGIITSLHFAMDELQEETPDRESAQASLDIAFTCAEHQLQLIETLLEINKLASGGVLAGLDKVNMADMAREAIDTVQNRAREAGIALSLTAPPGLDPLNADESILRRVLANLLDNALNFTPDGGSIQVTIRAHPTHQHITVTDTGPGIPEKDRERVFERFVQLDKGRRVRGSKGSGLGLTLCKLAVEAHGGRIWVDSGPEGGASFHFTLPTDLRPSLN
jgi:NtrC-family two-component system sensor histidine kinase KinB